jgi:predicted transcriptional regulator
MINFHLLIGRLAYKGRPTDEDKEYLASFVGKRKADGIIALAYSIRQSYEKEKTSNEDIETSEAFARNLESYRNSLIQRIFVIYEKVIQENEVARELVEGICFSPFLSKISKAD